VKRMLLALLAMTMLVAGGTTAFAHRGHDRGDKAKERLFTLTPDPTSNPEGIEFDKRTRSFYVSITGIGAPTGGDIYRGTLGSDTVEPFIPGGAGKNAIGIEKHRGKLYVAGGPSGSITVYDLKTKQAVATFQTGTTGFLNDLVVTKRGDVYVTDSFRPTLWHVTPEQVEAGSGTPQALDVSGGIEFVAGQFNLNGIVSKGARRLVVVNSFTGKLFRIDLNDAGDAIEQIDEIEGVNLKGDGMILDRGRLVVVTGNPAQLNFVKLRDGASRAELRGTQTSDKLHGPSTVARAKNLYLVVNADFARSASPPFTVAGLPARGHRDEDRGDDRGDDERGDDKRGDDDADDDDDHGGRGNR
jgi:sugar lactone lactonase YvrE